MNRFFNRRLETPRARCVRWMRKWLSETKVENGISLADRFREEYEKRPNDWWAQNGWHFFGGMGIRNEMRDNGFDEEELGVSNLDDIYIAIIEEAIDTRHVR